MSAAKPPMHFVCTLDEARALVSGRDRFWVSNCGCREGRKGCSKSRLDVCLMFCGEAGASGSGMREIGRAEVEAILAEARDKWLVARPFRDEPSRTQIGGICFCCDCCCGYFLNREEVCDKGELTERTDRELCNDCGDCVDVCHFEARRMQDGQLTVRRGNCYGCGLCARICPESAVVMTRSQA